MVLKLNGRHPSNEESPIPRYESISNLFLTLSILLCIACFTLAQANEASNYKLFESVDALDVEGVRKALNAGADPNARDPRHEGRRKVLEYLMMQLLVQRNERGRQGVFEIAKLLLERGAKIGIYENAVLFFPIAEGHIGLVKLLLHNGADPLRKFEGRSPMEWALYYQQNTVVKLLESYGVSKISAQEEAQVRLIKAAADHNLSGIIQALKSGARIDEKDSTGLTPLIAALRDPLYDNKQFLVVDHILNQGADPNLTGDSGFKDLEGIPIHMVVVMNTLTMNKPRQDSDKIATKVMRKLLTSGAKVSAMDSCGRTALHLAAKYNNVVAARILLEFGCRVIPKDNQGKTPLDYAESAEMIKLLKHHGAKEE